MCEDFMDQISLTYVFFCDSKLSLQNNELSVWKAESHLQTRSDFFEKIEFFEILNFFREEFLGGAVHE